MGKGDKQRPTFVSEEELQANWDRTFGPRPPRKRYVPPPDKPTTAPKVPCDCVPDYGGAHHWCCPNFKPLKLP